MLAAGSSQDSVLGPHYVCRSILNILAVGTAISMLRGLITLPRGLAPQAAPCRRNTIHAENNGGGGSNACIKF